MKKILAYCPVISDATSWYRGAGPLNALRRQFPAAVTVNYTDGRAEWFHLTGNDIVFLQRPCTADHLRFATEVKNANLPLWVDYDDLVSGLTPENSLYSFYEKCADYIPKIIRLADVVSVATNELAKWVRSVGCNNVAVIPNAWNDWIFPSLKESPAAASRKIVWRGCVGHCRDLSDVQSEIISLAKKYPDWEWSFVGWRPWFLSGPSFRHVEMMGLIEYFHWLRASEFNISIVPLADTPFNRAKSNIAWLETTQCGAVTIAPEWSGWQLPGIGHYPPGHFLDVIERIMAKPESLPMQWKLSQDYIFKNLLLTTTNKQRMEIVDGF